MSVTAEQLKSAIMNAIAEIETEATALADGLEKKDLAYPAAPVLDAMESDTKRYRVALDVIAEILEQLENGEGAK